MVDDSHVQLFGCRDSRERQGAERFVQVLVEPRVREQVADCDAALWAGGEKAPQEIMTICGMHSIKAVNRNKELISHKLWHVITTCTQAVSIRELNNCV